MQRSESHRIFVGQESGICGLFSVELLAARLAYEAAEKKNLKELLYLEELLEASRIPMEEALSH